MLILTVRTDKPEAELSLYDTDRQLATLHWQAHRELAETIHLKIQQLLTDNGYIMQSLNGIVCFQGPGSFTGLRIGLTVANSLAYALKLPIVANQGNSWQQVGIARLMAGENQTTALPYYGADVHITLQKK